MIFFKNDELDSVHFGKLIVSQICKGADIVWEAIKSCFGAGFWKNDAPWSNNEGWKNN